MPDTAVSGTTSRAVSGGSGEESSLPLITIYEISKMLGSTLNLERSLHDVLNILSSYMQMRRGVLTLDDEHGSLAVAAVAGQSLRDAQSGPTRFPLDAARQVISTAMPMVVHNMVDDPLFAAYAVGADVLDEEVMSLVCVPIKTVSRPFGTLSIERHRDGQSRFMFERDVRFLTMVGNLIGQAVSLERKVSADRERLILEKARLEKAMPRPEKPMTGEVLENVVGRSEPMQRVSAQVRQVAPSRATVLLRGESGTGKELIAKAIHYLSPRADKPFVKVNCAALPETLLESELFGHEKGAFTGATAERKGRFESASGGTLFLDEIGEISPHFQAKLLRVLQEGELERVGGNKTLKVDVRLVAATNKDLEEAVMKGEFRADLYYRINVVPVFLPALRERKEDIPLLAQFFLDKYNEENSRGLRFTPEAMQIMQCCGFPGNVRELENCVFRAATLAHGDVIADLGLSCRNNQCLSATLWQRPREGKPIGGLGRAPVTEYDQPDDSAAAWEQADGGFSTITPADMGAPAPAAASPMAPPTNGGMPGQGGAVPGGAGHGGQGMPASGAGGWGAPTGGADFGAMEDPGGLAESDGDMREKLVRAMEKAGWVQAKAARLLGMTPRQIGYALKKYDIEVKKI